jgi:hypothetical protein
MIPGFMGMKKQERAQEEENVDCRQETDIVRV